MGQLLCQPKLKISVEEKFLFQKHRMIMKIITLKLRSIALYQPLSYSS